MSYLSEREQLLQELIRYTDDPEEALYFMRKYNAVLELRNDIEFGLSDSQKEFLALAREMIIRDRDLLIAIRDA